MYLYADVSVVRQRKWLNSCQTFGKNEKTLSKKEKKNCQKNWKKASQYFISESVNTERTEDGKGNVAKSSVCVCVWWHDFILSSSIWILYMYPNNGNVFNNGTFFK